MGKCTKFNLYHSCSGEDEKTYKDNKGNEYCILHTPIEIRTRLDIENEFDQAVESKLNMSNYYFGGCQFKSPIKVRQYQPLRAMTLDFRDCLFENTFTSKGLTLGHSNFTGAQFLGPAIFDDTEFTNSETNFNNTTFSKEGSFVSCVFKNKISFNRVKYKTLNFHKSLFHTDCLFSFMDKIEDDKDTKYGVDFSDVIIDLDCKITFHLSDLINSQFSPRGKGILEFLGSSIKNVSFMNTDLSNCIFNRTDLSESFFSGAKLSETRFIDCSFREIKSLTYRRIVIFDEYYVRNKTIYKHNFTFFNFAYDRSFTLSALAETYRALKNNFEDNKDYVNADKFHFSEMEMKRALMGSDIISKDKSEKGSYFYNFLYYLKIKLFSFYPWYKYISGYGTSYTRAFLWILFSIFAFSILYMFSGLPNIEYEIGYPSNPILIIKDFAESLLYTIGILIPGVSKYFTDNVSMLTKWLTVIEFIVIWTLIPLFILALKRHFKR